MMKTVQVNLEDDLAQYLDSAVRRLRTTRSAFTSDALKAALSRLREAEREEKHREGYRRHPVQAGEFDAWLGEQVWRA